jgi:hypothetical protein
MAARAMFMARLILLFAFVAIAFMVAWAQAARTGEAQVRIGNFTFDPHLEG